MLHGGAAAPPTAGVAPLAERNQPAPLSSDFCESSVSSGGRRRRFYTRKTNRTRGREEASEGVFFLGHGCASVVWAVARGDSTWGWPAAQQCSVADPLGAVGGS